jgi:hypothetical protein
MTDVRAVAQLSTLPSLIAFNMIHATLALAVGLAAALLLLDGLGWRIVAVIFDRERLITSTPVIGAGPTPSRPSGEGRAISAQSVRRRSRNASRGFAQIIGVRILGGQRFRSRNVIGPLPGRSAHSRGGGLA